MADFNLSFVVPTFNQEKFIEESLWSVLHQDCPPTEILISDDNSTDQTFEIIEKVVRRYNGPHRVRFWKNNVNLGSGNILKCAERASHQRVVQFHGDDVSRPCRASRLFQTFEETGASLISSNATLTDATGVAQGPLVSHKPSGFDALEDVARAWHRSRTGSTQAFEVALVKDFTPWNPKNYWAAGDHILPFRAALLRGVYFLDEDLVLRRQHARNLGKEVNRRGDAKLAQAEIRLGHYLMVRSFMLRDLQNYIDRNEESDRLRNAKTLLTCEIERLTTEWSQARSEILNSGFRPSWVERSIILNNQKLQSEHVRPDTGSQRHYSFKRKIRWLSGFLGLSRT